MTRVIWETVLFTLCCVGIGTLLHMTAGYL